MQPKITVFHNSSVWLPQTQTWMYNQIRYVPADRIEPHVVCETTENLDQFLVPNIHCSSQDSTRGNYWDKALKKARIRRYDGYLVRVARRHQAHLLHSHFGDSGWANISAAKKAGIGHVVTFYGYDVNFLPNVDERWLDRYKKLFETADRILCEGSYMAGSIVKLGCPQSKVKVQHLGVEIDRIEFRPRTWKPGETLRVLIAASFREKKGIPYALEALGRLKDEVPLEITIIGDAGNVPKFQEEKRQIMEIIKKYNLKTCTDMMGYQPHTVLFNEAYKHHIFLSPSVTARDGDSEGGAPVTIIELAASGMPIVSSFHCDIPEVVKHGVTGLLAEERDVTGIIKHLHWLIANPVSWNEMLKAARKHIENEYDVVQQGARLASIYEEVVEIS